MSDELLQEIRDVLTRPEIRRKNARYTDQDIEILVDRLERIGKLIADLPAHFRYERDPGDEHLIDLAIEANAEYLVSRDKDLLDLRYDPLFRARYPGLTIADPVEFLKRLEAV